MNLVPGHLGLKVDDGFLKIYYFFNSVIRAPALCPGHSGEESSLITTLLSFSNDNKVRDHHWFVLWGIKYHQLEFIVTTINQNLYQNTKFNMIIDKQYDKCPPL